MKRVRYHVEVRIVEALDPKDDKWSRETLAGARTLRGARLELKAIRKAVPYKNDKLRIVRETTTVEVVR